MKKKLVNKTREEIPRVKGLLEAIKSFESKIDPLLSGCMVSIDGGSSLIQVLNIKDATERRRREAISNTSNTIKY